MSVTGLAGHTAGVAIRNGGSGTYQWLDADYDNNCGNRVSQSIYTGGGVANMLAFYGTSCLFKTQTTPAASVADNADYSIISRYSATAQSVLLNSTEAAQSYASVGSFFATSTPVGIGSGWNGGIAQTQRRVLGRMYAAFFIDRVLDDTERADLDAWLRAKAGI
jgi:hypothetical protein